MTRRAMIHGNISRAFILLALTAFTGCSQVKDKAHDLGSAFSGNYDTLISAPPAQTTEATKAAVRDLDLILISTDTDTSEQPNKTTVVARNKQDERATITIIPEGQASSRVVVSTGVFGNPTLRQQLIDQIHAHLGSTTQSTNPSSQPVTQPG